MTNDDKITAREIAASYFDEPLEDIQSAVAAIEEELGGGRIHRSELWTEVASILRGACNSRETALDPFAGLS